MPFRRLGLIAALALVTVPAAHADADPASDTLLFKRIYLPYFGEKVSPEHAAVLKKVVDEARKKGYPVKVALIATRNDLGGIFQLWEKPQTYARFLGIELSGYYRGKLIAAMPNGLGAYQYKNPVTTEKALVKTIKVGPGADGIADAASIAVAKLAGLPPPKLPKNDTGGGGDGTPVWELVVIIGGGVAILAAMLGLGTKPSAAPDSIGFGQRQVGNVRGNGGRSLHRRRWA